MATWLFSKLWSAVAGIKVWLLAGVGILAAVATIYLKGGSSREDKIRRETLERAYEIEKDRRTIQDTVRGMSDAELDSVLSEWDRARTRNKKD